MVYFRGGVVTIKQFCFHTTASGLQDLLILYFSHPAVEGVLLWGFWDGVLWLDDSKLAEGPNVTVIVADVLFLSHLQVPVHSFVLFHSGVHSSD